MPALTTDTTQMDPTTTLSETTYNNPRRQQNNGGVVKPPVPPKPRKFLASAFKGAANKSCEEDKGKRLPKKDASQKRESGRGKAGGRKPLGLWALEECEELTSWANAILKKKNCKQITDLRISLSDGVTIVNLLEILANEPLGGIENRPTSRAQKVDNVQRSFDYLHKNGVELNGFRSEEIVDGNLNSSLMLMNKVRNRYDLSGRESGEGAQQPPEISSRPGSARGQRSETDRAKLQQRIDNDSYGVVQRKMSIPPRKIDVNGLIRSKPQQLVGHGGADILPGTMSKDDLDLPVAPAETIVSTTELDMEESRKQQERKHQIASLSSRFTIRPKSAKAALGQHGDPHQPPVSAAQAWSTPAKHSGSNSSPLTHNNINTINYRESGNVRDTVSMTVEERLKSLLSGPTLGGSTEQRARVDYEDDGELLLPLPPQSRRELMARHDGIDNSGLEDDEPPGYHDNFRPPSALDEGYQPSYIAASQSTATQPSLPTDRLQGSRGEAILERRVPSVSPHHSLYSPDGTHGGHVTRPEHPPYQHPPAYQQPQTSGARGNELRDAWNKLYGASEKRSSSALNNGSPYFIHDKKISNPEVMSANGIDYRTSPMGQSNSSSQSSGQSPPELGQRSQNLGQRQLGQRSTGPDYAIVSRKSMNREETARKSGENVNGVSQWHRPMLQPVERQQEEIKNLIQNGLQDAPDGSAAIFDPEMELQKHQDALHGIIHGIHSNVNDDDSYAPSEASSRSVTPPLPPLSPCDTPPLPDTPPESPIIPARYQRSISAMGYSATKPTPDLLTHATSTISGLHSNMKMNSVRRSSSSSGQAAKAPWENRPGHHLSQSQTNPMTSSPYKSPKVSRAAAFPLADLKENDDHDDTDADNESNLSSVDFNNTLNSAKDGSESENVIIRQQLDGLETMYHEILKLLGVDKEELSNQGGELRGRGKSRFHRPGSLNGKSYHKHRSRELKAISKRFARLESHVVTLARSVAHLSSEMRSQNTMFKEIEELRQQVQEIRNLGGATGPAGVSGKQASGAADWERFRGWVPSLTNPQRVKKLTQFFGAEPPLLRLFLKKLGYEKYVSNFETEKIGMIELPYMNEERLSKIGIPMGPRMRILQESQLCFRQENFNIYIV